MTPRTYPYKRVRGLADWNPHRKTRDLLKQVRAVLEEYRDPLPLTCRQVFYRLVGAYGFDKSENTYARLLETLNRARRAWLVAIMASLCFLTAFLPRSTWATMLSYCLRGTAVLGLDRPGLRSVGLSCLPWKSSVAAFGSLWRVIPRAVRIHRTPRSPYVTTEIAYLLCLPPLSSLTRKLTFLKVSVLTCFSGKVATLPGKRTYQ